VVTPRLLSTLATMWAGIAMMGSHVTRMPEGAAEVAAVLRTIPRRSAARARPTSLVCW